ncbi:MAG: TonB family protein [Candidatus Acidiferrales bacterium]
MFLDFYRLREQPFSETPDPRFVYLSATHREALASLFYGIETGRGFLALIAEPGMGKTTLLFHLLEQLRSSSRTAFLFQTQCDSRELLRSLLADLGIDAGKKDLAWMHDQLKRVLIGEASAGRRLVVFIDETQNLTESALETVRLLSDFETPTSKLMQIVLAGQPQLADKLARPTLAQLRQRVSILCRLNPFTPAETDAYINHRLLVAGYKGGPLFTPDARVMIEAQSKGIPRNINNLCFNALSLGYALGKKEIDSSLVREVANDLEVSPLGSEQREAAFAARLHGVKGKVSEAGQQLSSLPAASEQTTLIPEPAKPTSVADEEAETSEIVAGVDLLSHDPEVSVPDSLLAAAISPATSGSRPRQKWVRVLSLAGQQLPTMPAASESATQVLEPTASSAVAEPKKQDLKAFPAEPPRGRAAVSKAGLQSSTVPTGYESTTLLPKPARPSTATKPETQESAGVADADAAPFDLEAPVAPPLPATTIFPRGTARLKHTWRMALFLKNDRVKLARWSALAALGGLLAVVSLSLRESGAHQGVASVSPIATANAEEKPSQPAVSGSSTEPRKSKSKPLSSTFSPRSNPGSAPLDGSLAKEPMSAPIRVPIDPNITSPSLVAIAPNSPMAASPAPKSPQPEQDRILEPSYLLYRVEPAYPQDAQAQDVEGTVRMRALVGQDGRVRSIELVSGPPLLVAAAMSAAREWRYIPAILNGQPVESEEDIRIDFRLPHGSLRGAG